ncbi:MAG: glutathione S-transferase family protein [Pseudomonadota bacterium]
MRTLYHFSLLPACRIVRSALAEKNLDVELKAERIWERREEFMAVNPAGEVPVLIEPDGTTLTELWVITEYLDEVYGDCPLLGEDPLGRAETRRLMVWFDQRFGTEVTNNLVGEKVLRRFYRSGQPVSEKIRQGKDRLSFHLDYIDYLAEHRNWLAGDDLTYADLVAASHISAVDYLGDIPWDKHREAKNWYARVKCRPSFRPILDELVPGVAPARHYKDLDF